MLKFKISKVLEIAIDNLWDGTPDSYEDPNYHREIQCCYALWDAEESLGSLEEDDFCYQDPITNNIFRCITDWVSTFDVEADPYNNFHDGSFKTDEERQGARFLWLNMILEVTRDEEKFARTYSK
jgi:hypothetical protein